MPSNRHPVALLLLAVALLFGAAPAAAQDNPITLQAEAGFDNYYKRGQWTPIRVTVANSGPDVEGILVIDYPAGTGSDRIRYQVPVSLPGQSRKVVTLYVGPDGYLTQWIVRLIVGEDVLAQARIEPHSLDAKIPLYAVAGGELVDLTVLEDVRQDATVAYIDLDDLPADAPAWESLDVLILNDVDTGRLTPDRRSALERWVTAGGHLVVTGGPNWRQTAAGVADLLPVQITGDVSAYGLGALEALTGEAVGRGPFVVAQASLLDGTVLISQDDLPLLARRKHGVGRVDWLALDLALAPLRDWDGREQLWNHILSAGDLRPPWARPTINSWSVREGLKSLPSLALPSTLQMAAFLLVYVVAVGPINYLFLKRLGRRELGWITIPALILTFSALAYLTGFRLRGSELIFNRLSLVYGAAGAEEAHARTLVGLYSPRRDTYDLTLSPGVLIRPLATDNTGGLSTVSAATVHQTDRFELRDVQIDIAGLRAFRAEAHVPNLPVRGTLTVAATDPPHLSGTLTYDGDFTLQDASLLVGENLVELGDLVPGATVQVDEKLTSDRSARGSTNTVGSGLYLAAVKVGPYGGAVPLSMLTGSAYSGTDSDLYRRAQTLNAFGVEQSSGQGLPQGATLVGWSDKLPWEIGATGRASQTIDTVSYLIELPVEITAGSSTWVVPPALTTWTLLSGEHHQYGPSGPYDIYLASDWVAYEYRPWDGLRLPAVDELIVTVKTSGNQTTVHVSLWDWQEERWIEHPDLLSGNNVIERPARFLGPGNAVRLRLEVDTLAAVQIERAEVTYRGGAQ